MRRIGIGIVVVLVSACASQHAGGWKTLPMRERQSALVHELGVIGLSTNAAKLIRAGKTEQALRLLEHRLESSSATALELLQAGTRLPSEGAFPNLMHSAQRAHEYAVENQLGTIARRTEEISRLVRE